MWLHNIYWLKKRPLSRLVWMLEAEGWWWDWDIFAKPMMMCQAGSAAATEEDLAGTRDLYNKAWRLEESLWPPWHAEMSPLTMLHDFKGALLKRLKCCHFYYSEMELRQDICYSHVCCFCKDPYHIMQALWRFINQKSSILLDHSKVGLLLRPHWRAWGRRVILFGSGLQWLAPPATEAQIQAGEIPTCEAPCTRHDSTLLQRPKYPAAKFNQPDAWMFGITKRWISQWLNVPKKEGYRAQNLAYELLNCRNAPKKADAWAVLDGKSAALQLSVLFNFGAWSSLMQMSLQY